MATCKLKSNLTKHVHLDILNLSCNNVHHFKIESKSRCNKTQSSRQFTHLNILTLSAYKNISK